MNNYEIFELHDMSKLSEKNKTGFGFSGFFGEVISYLFFHFH